MKKCSILLDRLEVIKPILFKISNQSNDSNESKVSNQSDESKVSNQSNESTFKKNMTNSNSSQVEEKNDKASELEERLSRLSENLKANETKIEKPLDLSYLENIGESIEMKTKYDKKLSDNQLIDFETPLDLNFILTDPMYLSSECQEEALKKTIPDWLTKTFVPKPQTLLNNFQPPLNLSSSTEHSIIDPNENPEEEYSFTKTHKGQQFESISERLLQSKASITCQVEEKVVSYTPQANFEHSHSHIPQYYSNDVANEMPQFVMQNDQKLPIIYNTNVNKTFSDDNVQQIIYQPNPELQTRMPLIKNVPVVFRPNQLKMFDSALSVKANLAKNNYKSKSNTSFSSTSAYPLLTAQRPGQSLDSTPMKSIEIEGDMFDSFMKAVHFNTSNRIETCGILTGKYIEISDSFSVTHLIIPQQTGTTDTCATINEEAIFEFQIKNDLLTLGWIHTHPTQACFLSSVDLHTQSSYQSLFQEAIAIVIAPKDTPEFSIFHLSNAGLKKIQSCPRKGFHLHDEKNLYQTCRHVQLKWPLFKSYKIVDMR